MTLFEQLVTLIQSAGLNSVLTLCCAAVQEFSSDMNSRPVKRIEDVVRLRTAQFSEDSGPIAHPIRPESYIKMDNFYTVTVYEKGAEIIRVYHTLLGKEGFRYCD